MSDDQPIEASAETIEPKNAWGDSISDERKAELKTLADQQRDRAALSESQRGDSYFAGVHLNGADVFWLATYALAGPTGNMDEAEKRLRATSDDLILRLSLDLSTLHLEESDLRDAHLEAADLRKAHLEGITAAHAYMERVVLYEAHLEGADLRKANLEEANLIGSHLEQATLSEANLERADLRRAQMDEVTASRARLGGANLENAHLEGAHLAAVQLTGAFMNSIHLVRANLSFAMLKQSDLYSARLEGADLNGAHLEGSTFCEASFDKTSRLSGAHLNGAALDQVIFDNANLTVVDWREVKRLGDETKARHTKALTKKTEAYHSAARAYRALAVVLRNQGLGSEATRFHYRAEVMTRYRRFFNMFALLFSRRFYAAPNAFIHWLLSWLLGTFAGYGDRLGRLFVTYLVTVSVFAGLMFAVAGRPPSFDSIRDVYVLSITSFHGRGIQPPGLHLNDALATLTAIEAFFGLAIEGIFIAAFTRRVTGN